ncbi:cytochrome bd-I oxidase subunit CydX [Edwardsiella tarda]|uniref:Cytochrome bd-I oxidase subunit CydX n=3 Tax=Edwardsiella tarda TaxID=636 RepID=A0A2A7U106_EDWTA|nr:cytochrome bd-I oxidase subunit CydX [Edwardsiella tarda]ATI65009.1 cytochrome bd-I oxidase subunit CydX [Edwardsiella tarda]EFE21981.1 cyd operon protein YbgT [Edwardsiella tarda ATCC 23685]PEH71971.1 cytochrome bd-I oxidase subunit CydX [Edwardsiella tarda]UAL55930.1 cytochrome bd-I oxidase subunit CydX [Edwardsiella tarda]UBU95261.1 cytochrome bd-I oxidase subunit CydX [Edwardsiella tarda]
MWYFAWVLGTLMACFFAIITAMAIENSEAKKAAQDGK